MEVLGMPWPRRWPTLANWQQAADVLSRSYTPERPNWSEPVRGGMGSIADQLGDQAQAQTISIATRLETRAWIEPAILSNLGLSYALTRQQLLLAEQVLRQASGSPRADTRVRAQSRAGAVLQGKFAEAEQIERQDHRPQGRRRQCHRDPPG